MLAGPKTVLRNSSSVLRRTLTRSPEGKLQQAKPAGLKLHIPHIRPALRPATQMLVSENIGWKAGVNDTIELSGRRN
jgi:hypothetical protein